MKLNDIVPQKHVTAFIDTLQDVYNKYAPGQERNLTDAERRQKMDHVNSALTAFFRRPAKVLGDAQEKIRELAYQSMSKADIPEILTSTASIFRSVANYDTAFEASFMDAIVEPGRNWWEIVNLTNGVTFRKIPEGGRVVVEGLSGTKAIVFVPKYGAAIGWSDEEVRFRQYNSIAMKSLAFRDSLGVNRADNHYALLAGAIGSNTTSYQTVTGSEVNSDIKTLNLGAYTLANRLKNGIFGDVLGQEMLLYFNPIIWARVIRALSQTGQDVQGMPNRILFNIRPIPTFNQYLTNPAGGSTNTTALLVMPGGKTQKATVMEPTSYMAFDPLTLTYDQSVFTYYGAAAEGGSDDGQTQSIAFA